MGTANLRLQLPSGPPSRPRGVILFAGIGLALISVLVFFILNFTGGTYFSPGNEPHQLGSIEQAAAPYLDKVKAHDPERNPADLLAGQQAIQDELRTLVKRQDETNERIKVLITLGAGILSLLFLAVSSAVVYAVTIWGKVARFEESIDHIAHSAEITSIAANDLRLAVNHLYTRLGEPLH